VAESTKSEARNPKQIQMTKNPNVPNKEYSESEFWIFRVWNLFDCFCFGFGASDFGFCGECLALPL